MPETTTTPTAPAAGLRGVTAATSSISDVIGDKGQLIYQGYDIHDLATQSTFEEVIFLLWNKRLPKRGELEELEKALAAAFEIPPETVELMKRYPSDADPIDVLRTSVSALEFYDSNSRDLSREASIKTAIKLTAQFPTLVAAAERIRKGQQVLKPDASLNIAANFLYMLRA
ncbi:MAG: citrate/2-methylcitrate synthase, partial [Pyrinomonadaceae bacterium]